MLTADLIQTRVYKGEVRPRYVDPADPERLALAGQLIDLFKAHVGAPRHALEEELQALLGTGTAFLFHRALAKLLRDRCRFETRSPVPPEELRRAVFSRAAACYQAPEDDSGRRFRLARDAILAAAAEDLELTPQQVEQGLYADLKDEQVLEEFRPCTPRWLLDRYNVALAQGVLYRAVALTVEVGGQSAARYRALFRKIKFFQLMHRVERLDDGYRIHLDGPLSVLKASGRYGLQMASFLPTLLHFDGWRLEAELRWTRARRKRVFRLKAEEGLHPHNRLTGVWQPEELRWLPERFAELGSAWNVSTDAELVDLGGEGVLVPDFVFAHPSGVKVLMEVFGFWNRGAVRSRLQLLRRHGPKNLILALSKRLAAAEDDLDELPGEIYVFRTTPLPRQVLKRLEAFL